MNLSYGVVIPHYARVRQIAIALDSIVSQSYPVKSVVIVDDASPQSEFLDLQDLVISPSYKNISITLFRNPCNLGPSSSRNTGFDLLRDQVDIVCFLDSDDAWSACKISTIDRVFRQANSPDIVIHSYANSDSFVDVSGLPFRRLRILPCLISNKLQTSCLSQTMSTFQYFDPSMRFSEDYEYLLRALHSGLSVSFSSLCLTRLGRPENTHGGLSSERFRMRAGEIKAYMKFSRSIRSVPLYPLIFIVIFAKCFKTLVTYLL